jgi:hypothetical protein
MNTLDKGLAVARQPQPASACRISHGPSDSYFENIAGKPIASVRRGLATVFSIPTDAEAFVGGSVVAPGYKLRAGVQVEFLKLRGRKGIGDDRDAYFIKSPDAQLKLNEIIFRLNRLEDLLRQVLNEQAPAKDFYSVEEFGKLVDLAPYTVREHCRLGRLQASKAACGRGRTPEWRISHSELVRYRSYGLLPLYKAPISLQKLTP